MGKATIFWLSLATICGVLLFHTSQEVTDGRTALRNMERDVLREEESLRVLQAEWSYLNQPERLEKLAREYLELQPLNGRQFTRISDINERIDEDALAVASANTPAAIEPAAGTHSATAKARAKPAEKPRLLTAKIPAAKATPVAKPVAVKPASSRAFDDVLKNLGVN